MQERAPGAAPLEQLADLLIGFDVGPPEAIDRLFRIADDEQLAGNRCDPPPVAFGRIVGGQQQQDLGLQRVGVLELVDEDMREPRLERPADARVLRQQIAGAQQQVDEIERAGALLEPLVAGNGIAKLVVQQGGEVAVGRILEPVELAASASRRRPTRRRAPRWVHSRGRGRGARAGRSCSGRDR